jgi:HSP20 family molecular chaperone IbpA
MSHEASLQERKAQHIERPERTEVRPTFVPLCDIYETEDGLVILADMPGVDEKNVDVSLEKGVLTIRGKSQDHPMPGYQLSYAEHRWGDYERMFRISDDFDAGKIGAVLRNGVLRIILPKAARAKPQKITVRME